MATNQKRNMTVGLIIVAIVAALILYFSLQDNSPMVPLFSYELETKQVQQVEDYLKKNDYFYELKGKEVLVRQSKFEEILVKISQEGIPTP